MENKELNKIILQHEIKIHKNVVIKSDNPKLMRIEVEKTRRAFEIGKNCGLFRVPRLLDFNEPKGIVIFERLYNIQNISKILAIQHKSNILHVKKIAESLAVIHRELILPENMISPLPDRFQFPGNSVFIHGDFNGLNVCIDNTDGSIVILDWQTTGECGGQATYGSFYFDLMFFINWIFLWTFRSILFKKNAPLLSRVFLKNYFETADHEYNHRELIIYMKKFFSIAKIFKRKRISQKKRLYLMSNYLQLYLFFTLFHL